jgi:probable ribonuclease FAU-1
MTKTKPNVFIRGIFSTALTKLFIDAGYPIIFPSAPIQKRFNIPFRPSDNYSKDITIQDRHDKQGISIMFKKNVWDELEKDNFSDFPLSHEIQPDLIIHEARFHKNAIYRGLVIQTNKEKRFSSIRLTPEDISDGKEDDNPFQTTLGRFARGMDEAKEGIFQVTHEDFGKIRASLGSFYTIPGDLIVIVPYNSKVIISKEIKNGKHKKRLFDLGKDIQKTKKYGFIFRTAAELASDNEIREEVEKLDADLVETQKIITDFPDKIGEIYSNYRSVNILFPKGFKDEMDTIRRSITSTLPNHHFIKGDLEYANFLKKKKSHHRSRDNKSRDHRNHQEPPVINTNLLLFNYTEDLIKEIPKTTHEKVGKFFENQYYKKFLKNRAYLNINHQKLSGKNIQLTSGTIKSVSMQEGEPIRITLKRIFREGGVYDGLNTPIERGDYAIGEYEMGAWSYVSSYYSKDNELKGKYYNINTPLEVSDQGLRYFDLEIDIVENMIGKRKIIDKELLDQALSLKLISQTLYDKAIEVSEEIMNKKKNK